MEGDLNHQTLGSCGGWSPPEPWLMLEGEVSGSEFGEGGERRERL